MKVHYNYAIRENLIRQLVTLFRILFSREITVDTIETRRPIYASLSLSILIDRAKGYCSAREFGVFHVDISPREILFLSAVIIIIIIDSFRERVEK